MRKWMVTLGLAVALLVALLLLPRSRPPTSPAAPGAPPAAPAAPGPATAAPPVALPPQHPPTSDDAMAAMHKGLLDEDTRLVLTYPITMERLLAYTAAVKAVRAAGERDPKLMARLREQGPAGERPAAMAARLEAIRPLKAILDRHGVTGLDLVLLPRAVVVGRNAYALEQEGRPLPAEEQNVAATGLFRADLPRMDRISKEYLADLRALAGR